MSDNIVYKWNDEIRTSCRATPVPRQLRLALFLEAMVTASAVEVANYLDLKIGTIMRERTREKKEGR